MQYTHWSAWLAFYSPENISETPSVKIVSPETNPSKSISSWLTTLPQIPSYYSYHRKRLINSQCKYIDLHHLLHLDCWVFIFHKIKDRENQFTEGIPILCCFLKHRMKHVCVTVFFNPSSTSTMILLDFKSVNVMLWIAQCSLYLVLG